MIVRFAYILIVFAALFALRCNHREQTAYQPANTMPNASPAPDENLYRKLTEENETEAKQALAKSAVFESKPERFKGVDFKNFTFPVKYPGKRITLRDGRYSYEDRKWGGGGWFELGPVYYLDLTGDGREEALVFLFSVSCGGSCDGGAYTIYVYSKNSSNPKLIWQLGLGSEKYGCSLRNVTVTDGTIELDLYGDCVQKRGEYMDFEFANLKPQGEENSLGHTAFKFNWMDTSFSETSREHFGTTRLTSRNQRAIFNIVSGKPAKLDQ